jgi:hypothetical protein
MKIRLQAPGEKKMLWYLYINLYHTNYINVT